jgi:hypothetical protein
MSNGTFWAAAYFSGLAGLVKAANPNLTSLQIRDAILKNVDVKCSLSGKISIEGRINASKTLSGIVCARASSLSITSSRLAFIYPWKDKSRFTHKAIDSIRAKMADETLLRVSRNTVD